MQDIELDVHGLEPPEPFMRALAALESLAPGQHLLLRIHREPIMLYGRLASMGLAWEVVCASATEWRIRIGPAPTISARTSEPT